MRITEAELRRDLGKYLALARTEDVFIACGGEEVKLSKPTRGAAEKSLFGVLSDDIMPEKYGKQSRA